MYQTTTETINARIPAKKVSNARTTKYTYGTRVVGSIVPSAGVSRNLFSMPIILAREFNGPPPPLLDDPLLDDACVELELELDDEVEELEECTEPNPPRRVVELRFPPPRAPPLAAIARGSVSGNISPVDVI